MNTNDASLHPIKLTARLCAALRPSSPEASFEVGRPALQRAQNVAARLQAISTAGEDDDFRDLINALDGNGAAAQPAGSGAAEATLLQTIEAPHAQLFSSSLNGEQTLAPPQDIGELYWDPNLAFSNLDAWLSALDSNVDGSFAI